MRAEPVPILMTDRLRREAERWGAARRSPPVIEQPDPGQRAVWDFRRLCSLFDLVVGDRRIGQTAGAYPEPSVEYDILRGTVSFYSARVERCTVGGAWVRAQAGEFYAGWVTDELTGPFQGRRGTEDW